MKITIREGSIHCVDLRTRMPFKYGIAVMTEMPQAFIRLRVEVDGRLYEGISADLLPPKWFTKDPQKAVAAEIQEMLRVIRHAVTGAIGLTGASAFELWQQLYARQSQWGQAENLPPLLSNFGVSLVERALLEAVARAAGKPFWRMLQENAYGLQLERIHPELAGWSPAQLLPAQPLPRLFVRHTVGLGDPLTDAEISPAETLHDGLPQSLVACLRAYALSYFKIKVNGQLEPDLERLRRLAAILRQEAPADYAFTLDGNEQFKSLSDFRTFWEKLRADPSLHDFLQRLIFVEQPLHRSVALETSVGQAFRDWLDHPPVIIDESDATLESLPAALALGYAGTSHKNCKGIFKGIANRCLLRRRQTLAPNQLAMMSGEDLCNQGPVALLQDLAVMAALGIENVERNGHHYVAGLSRYSPEIQDQMLQAHGDLYRRSAQGWPTLDIQNGKLNLTSLNQSPFGVGFRVDVAQFQTVPL